MEKDWVPRLSSAAERVSTRPEEEKLACQVLWKVNGTFVGGWKQGYKVIDLGSTARTAEEGSMRTVRVGF